MKKQQTKLVIMLRGQPVVLKDFEINCKNGLGIFAVKYGYRGKERVALYWFDKETPADLLTSFFKACRKNNITPIDLICFIEDAVTKKKIQKLKAYGKTHN